MLSKLFDFSIVKKFFSIYIINIIIFIFFIVFGYNFTNSSVQHLKQIEKQKLPVSSITTSNLQLLEDTIRIFSDTALTNELEMIDGANIKKNQILANLNKLYLLNQNNSLKSQIILLMDYYNLAHEITMNIINNAEIDSNKIMTLQKLTKENLNLFKQQKEEAQKDLEKELTNISENTNIFFNNSLYMALFGLVFMTIANIYIHKLLKVRFKSLIESVKNLALAKPDFSKRLTSSKHDEIGETIHWFNQLQSKLEIDYHQLEQLKIQSEQSLEQEIEETQKEVVFTMGAIGESRSKETGNHVRRVAEYSKIFALKCGLSQEYAELLKQASPMHDIGKVGIADNILNKPGKLTFDEFDKMKEHSILGYEMLKNSNRPLLKLASTVAYEHHEKWNGSGYPRGLKGEEIDISGRITALADVFDALGSSRIYKKAWDDEKIFNLFKEEKGKHFDPKLVDIFFDNLDEFLEIRDGLQDKIA